jgi:hypothetical protein
MFRIPWSALSDAGQPCQIPTTFSNKGPTVLEISNHLWVGHPSRALLRRPPTTSHAFEGRHQRETDAQ